MERLRGWENFIETFTRCLSLALTEQETENLLNSFQSFQASFQKSLAVALASTPSSPAACKHTGRCGEHCARGFVRTFIIVYALKSLTDTVLLWRKRGTSRRPVLSDGGKDTLSFSLFMSLFTSGYKGLLCALRATRLCSSAYYPMIAGTVAGTSLLLDSNPSRRIMIALYVATRTGHYAARYLWKRYLQRHTLPGKWASKSAVSAAAVGSPPSLNNLPALQSLAPDCATTALAKLEPGRPPELPDNDDADSTHTLVVEPIPLSQEPPLTRRRRALLHQVMATSIMTLSSSVLLYAFVVDQSTLTRPYLSFLLTHSGIKDIEPKRALPYLQAIGSVVNAPTLTPGAEEKRMIARDGSPNLGHLVTPEMRPFLDRITRVPHPFVMCALQHPDHTSCSRGMLSAIQSELVQSLRLYGPLNLILMLLFNPRKLVTDPGRALVRLLRGTARSCLFLTCYVTAAWSLPCAFRNLCSTDRPWMYKLNGLLAGFMVLLEHPHRRLELGMYCLPRAVETLFLMYVRKGWLRPLRFGEVGLFSLCMGVLMSLYQYESDSIHEGMLRVMTRLFGVN